jgi:ribosomal protein S18 acetylase RimI-like enzyme
MTSDKIDIRPAQQQDITAMVLLLQKLFTLEEDFSFEHERQQAGLRILLDQSSAIVLVAELKGEVIGMCSGQTIISTAEGGPAMIVEDVVVSEPWQGMGIGRRLLQKLLERAGNEGICRLQLLADRHNNKALGFYETLGWHTTQLICLRTRTDNERK